MIEATNQSERIMHSIEEVFQMVPYQLAIPKEEPVEVCICKLATTVCDTRTEMARVQLELNLQIIELQLRAHPLTHQN